MSDGEYYVKVEGNTWYSLETKQLTIYDGTTTSPVVVFAIVNGRQISITDKGNVYVTVLPTYVKKRRSNHTTRER